MERRRLVALLVILLVGIPSLAAADTYLRAGTGLQARGVAAVQQHTVFVEIVQQETVVEDVVQIHQFAAIVALVKNCVNIRERRLFDDAVLWFNDQFLFGDKNRQSIVKNSTEVPGESEALGGVMNNPAEDEFDRGEDGTNNTGDETPSWDSDGTLKFMRRFGASSGKPTGQNGNSVGGPGPGRWVGCFVPAGFLHAVGADDPYGIAASGTNNIDIVENLIEVDHDPNCAGCVFSYVGSFYVTDPNGFNWLVDKHVYPAVVPHLLGMDCGGETNLHVNDRGAFASGCDAEQHRDTEVQEDADCNGVDDGFPPPTTVPAPRDDGCFAPDPGEQDGRNHCFEDSDTEEVCDANESDPTDTPRQDSVKVTTYEPLYTVHLQVDGFDMQGIRDEAAWAWRSGVVRPGTPRWEGDAGGFCPADNVLAECAIEYTAVIVVDFEAFDDLPLGPEGQNENTITRRGKTHGVGGADDADESKEGNAHPHNPTDDLSGPDCDPAGAGNGTADEAECPTRPLHVHDTVTLDLFFRRHNQTRCASGDVTWCGAPYFTVTNGGFRDGPGAVVKTGRPPRAVDPECLVDDGTHGEGSAPLVARVFIVCDNDADADELHLHDGSQTV